MLTKLRRPRVRITYANVMSTIAVFGVFATGSVYARAALIDGADLKPHSVRFRQLAKDSVNSYTVKNGTLLASDFKKGVLKRGTRGPKGATGAAGVNGLPGAKGAKGDTGTV